jgi:hypothetical protein
MRLTLQEYYDLIVVSALDGTFPSITLNGQCRYRGPYETKCLVGIIMPDEIYSFDLEGAPAGTTEVWDSIKDVVPQELDADKAEMLQRCHDRVALDGAWNPNELLKQVHKELRLNGLDTGLKMCAGHLGVGPLGVTPV